MSFLATKIYQCLLATNSRVVEKILLKIRAGILRFANPLICLSYRGFRLKMPFSHTIFYFQKKFPNFDMQLHKIARYIQHKEGCLGIVDVGANIGDTCVFMRAEGAAFLLIEGEKSYAELIKDNIALNDGKNAIISMGGGHNYILEQVFITDEIAPNSYEIYLDNGTGRLQSTSQSAQNNSHISQTQQSATALESSAESTRKSPLESNPKATLESISQSAHTAQSMNAPESKTAQEPQSLIESALESKSQTAQKIIESAPQSTSQTLDSTPQTAPESSAKSPLESAPHNTNLNAQTSAKTQQTSQNAKTPQTSQNLAFDSLDNLIIKHHFAPNLIKIDTDGFDFKVIRSAFETLKAHKSAIYFEWDAQCLTQNGENPVSIFSDLATLGYEECVIFDNFGNLLCVEKCQNRLNLGLLSDYMQDCNERIYYFDVLLFHKDKPLDAREFIAFARESL